MPIPSNVSTTNIVGKFIDPEGNDISGVFTFTPSYTSLKNITATPDKVTVLPKPLSVSLVGGKIPTGTKLISSDDPDNNPLGFTYEVSFKSSVAGVKLAKFSIQAPSDQTIDLAVVAPVSSSNGVPIIQGPQGLQGLQGPQGIQGIQGIQGLQGPAGTSWSASAWVNGTLGTNITATPNTYIPGSRLEGGDVTRLRGSVTIGGGGVVAGHVLMTLAELTHRPDLLVSGNARTAGAVFKLDIETNGQVITQSGLGGLTVVHFDFFTFYSGPV